MDRTVALKAVLKPTKRRYELELSNYSEPLALRPTPDCSRTSGEQTLQLDYSEPLNGIYRSSSIQASSFLAVTQGSIDVSEFVFIAPSLTDEVNLHFIWLLALPKTVIKSIT
ncbi:unnamed protein product [Ceratitis capitata]|uniref:(Mediterranean fruit fly) hypothetical protein n=1 Tax=Ceratitis capitata TaxID=7213 RepID=A0A811UPE6_CERCA|nr:unnamed protein product [Ceratitis capitata]